jgi:cell division protein FtsX
MFGGWALASLRRRFSIGAAALLAVSVSMVALFVFAGVYGVLHRGF